MSDAKELKYWTELAAYDLEVAEGLLTIGKYLYIGFMCHMVIEKMLKAHIVKVTSKMPPKIHNLPRLATLGGIYDSMSESQKIFLDKIDNLNIETRYPEHKDRIFKILDRPKCQEIVSSTKEICRWLTEKL
jgi:HEPN domain-containing protein